MRLSGAYGKCPYDDITIQRSDILKPDAEISQKEEMLFAKCFFNQEHGIYSLPDLKTHEKRKCPDRKFPAEVTVIVDKTPTKIVKTLSEADREYKSDFKEEKPTEDPRFEYSE